MLRRVYLFMFDSLNVYSVDNRLFDCENQKQRCTSGSFKPGWFDLSQTDPNVSKIVFLDYRKEKAVVFKGLIYHQQKLH